MHSHRIFFLGILLLIAVQSSWQQTPSLTNDDTVQMEPCKTSRNMTGFCVIRKVCDYGTISIDKTLYSKQGYMRSCAMDKVCCPSEFIAPTPKEEPQKEFTFDDD